MTIERYDEELQLAILTSLVRNYPQQTSQDDLEKSFGSDLLKFDFNLYYLWDHKMIVWQTKEPGFPRAVRATAKGIDYLRGEGKPS